MLRLALGLASAVTGLAVLLSPVPTRAAPSAAPSETPKVRLVYLRDGVVPAELCPEEAEVRSMVAARLGYDPFSASAARIVVVRLTRRGAAVVGHFEEHGDDGRETGTRDISSAKGDCQEVVSALSIAVAIDIDPLSATRPPTPATSATTSPAAPMSAAPPASLPPPPSAQAPPAAVPVPPREKPVGSDLPWQLRAGGGAVVAVGAAPSVDAGLVIYAGVRRGMLSVALEGRADFPVSAQAVDGGSVSASLAMASLVPCIHRAILRGCAVAGVGVLRGAGAGVTNPQEDTKPYVAMGGRLGIEAKVTGPLFFDAHADALLAATRITLRLDGRDVWTTPTIGGVFGAGLSATFP